MNGRASKAKGYRAEVEGVEFYGEAGYWPEVERNGNRYGPKDQGDLGRIPEWAIQIKNVATATLGAFVADAQEQAQNARKKYHAVHLKLRGRHMRRGLFIMSAEQGRRVMKELEECRNAHQGAALLRDEDQDDE
ncbi:hypothetical protein [Streptomyces sp. NPDC050507]|uniref:hypothetical protein n=1 Tax=Streptomyces sp. NPDC050507 TaxID=3365619 RepID=UPI0037B451B4